MGVNPENSSLHLQTLEEMLEPSQIQPWQTLEPTQAALFNRTVASNSHGIGIVYPTTQAALAAVLAHANRQHWQILPLGAGSKLDWGGTVGGKNLGDSGEPESTRPLLGVSTVRLNQLIEHAIGDLTITVEAGRRYADLQATLAQAGQFLAIDPTYPDQATIGGIVATADTGSLRQRYHSVRDMLLGVSFVRADGQAVKAGGRVVKNVAGYDLMKLLTGSYGTLGVITQVTFRVYPLPESSQTLGLRGDAGAIARATQTLLSSALTPTSVDLLSASIVQALGMGRGMGLLIRFQSIAPSVQEQANRMLDVGRTLGLVGSSYSQATEENLWQQLREQMTLTDREGDVTCKIGVEPSAAVAVLNQLETLTGDRGFGQIYAGCGLGRLLLRGPVQPESLLKLRTLCQANSGFLSILQAPSDLKQTVDIWGYSGDALLLMRKLKQQFDPDALLSPHRFVGGL